MNRMPYNLNKLVRAILIFSAVAGMAPAQDSAATGADSRTAILAALQEAKSRKVKPYTPDRVEAVFHKLAKVLLMDPSGFYPYYGSVYQGGGLTLGAGYRHFYGDNTN